MKSTSDEIVEKMSDMILETMAVVILELDDEALRHKFKTAIQLAKADIAAHKEGKL